jgi:hypothetical protein
MDGRIAVGVIVVLAILVMIVTAKLIICSKLRKKVTIAHEKASVVFSKMNKSGGIHKQLLSHFSRRLERLENKELEATNPASLKCLLEMYEELINEMEEEML